jgi:hypothetical protein
MSIVCQSPIGESSAGLLLTIAIIASISVSILVTVARVASESSGGKVLR